MPPTSWLYTLARRAIGVNGRPPNDEESSRKQSYRRRVSRVFHELLAASGVDVGVRVERPSRAPEKWRPSLFARAQVPELSGHVPTVIVPHGWTSEEDIREELLALSELVALRKVG